MPSKLLIVLPGLLPQILGIHLLLSRKESRAVKTQLKSIYDFIEFRQINRCKVHGLTLTSKYATDEHIGYTGSYVNYY